MLPTHRKREHAANAVKSVPLEPLQSPNPFPRGATAPVAKERSRVAMVLLGLLCLLLLVYVIEETEYPASLVTVLPADLESIPLVRELDGPGRADAAAAGWYDCISCVGAVGLPIGVCAAR